MVTEATAAAAGITVPAKLPEIRPGSLRVKMFQAKIMVNVSALLDP